MMAERYERRSLLITSNLVFSEWDRIFKNPMTTAAAIDRVVHHSVILEFAGVTSYRGEEAKDRLPRTDAPPPARATKRSERAEAGQ
jgi:DNA replication protein DnaC